MILRRRDQAFANHRTFISRSEFEYTIPAFECQQAVLRLGRHAHCKRQFLSNISTKFRWNLVISSGIITRKDGVGPLLALCSIGCYRTNITWHSKLPHCPCDCHYSACERNVQPIMYLIFCTSGKNTPASTGHGPHRRDTARTDGARPHTRRVTTRTDGARPALTGHGPTQDGSQPALTGRGQHWRGTAHSDGARPALTGQAHTDEARLALKGHGPHSSQLVNCVAVCTVCVSGVVLCTVCVYMCTVLLPPGVNPIAVNKYIIKTERIFSFITSKNM